MVAPANSKHEVLARLASRRQLLRDVGVRRLGRFGSFLTDEQRAGSDVDFLVEFDPARKSFDNFWMLSEILEETMQRPVDLVTVESLSPHVGPRILAQVEYVPLAEWSAPPHVGGD